MSTGGARSADLEAQASAWAARLDADPNQHPHGLDDWLAEHPRHAGALLRAQAILATFSPQIVEADAAGEEAGQLAPSFWRRRRIWVGGATALAASLAAFMMTGQAGETYETQIGEVRSLALNDGSAVSIDAKSRIDLNFTPGRRDVVLRSGKVLFRATHDARRPFRVILDNVVVTDIGTAFQVTRDDSDQSVDVLVTEGAVQVDGPAGRMTLIAGQRARFFQTQAASVNPVPTKVAVADIDRLLAWRNGQLDLNGETLEDAIGEINRHSRIQLRVSDPALARESLYGTFRMDDPAGFARTVAIGLGANVRVEPETIIITSERK